MVTIQVVDRSWLTQQYLRKLKDKKTYIRHGSFCSPGNYLSASWLGSERVNNVTGEYCHRICKKAKKDRTIYTVMAGRSHN
jgi:hypothetical protein